MSLHSGVTDRFLNYTEVIAGGRNAAWGIVRSSVQRSDADFDYLASEPAES